MVKFTRREFLKVSAAVAVCAAAEKPLSVSTEGGGSGKPRETLVRRPLGKTGVELSVIGLGGIVLMNSTQEHANEVVARAIEAGVNYFDVAPTYGDAELRMGPALKPHREKAFLACKTTKRDRKGAAEELQQSLKRLETDHLDLYQLHAISKVKEDVDQALGPDGAIQAIVQARRKGLIRFIGFSAHSVEAALKAIEEFPFDTILYPINYVCHFAGNFDQRVLEAAKGKQMGILALKAMARTPRPKNAERTFPKCWYQPISDAAEADLALRWALSQGATAAVAPGEEPLFWMAVEIARQLRPVTEAEVAHLEHQAQSLEPIFKHEEA